MSDQIRDRKEFEDHAASQADISPAEIASAVNDGSVLLRLVGKLVRDQRQMAVALTYIDLISESGRLEAIKQQGIVQGRAILLESLIDLIIEGANDGN